MPAQTVRLSGWVHRKRDHGELLFIDLRDHYGLTQCVVDSSQPAVRRRSRRCALESVITVTGQVVERTPETVNDEAADRRDRGPRRGRSRCSRAAEPLPLQVISDADYRRGDRACATASSTCAREKLHSNIMLRSRSSPASAGA